MNYEEDDESEDYDDYDPYYDNNDYQDDENDDFLDSSDLPKSLFDGYQHRFQIPQRFVKEATVEIKTFSRKNLRSDKWHVELIGISGQSFVTHSVIRPYFSLSRPAESIESFNSRYAPSISSGYSRAVSTFSYETEEFVPLYHHGHIDKVIFWNGANLAFELNDCYMDGYNACCSPDGRVYYDITINTTSFTKLKVID